MAADEGKIAYVAAQIKKSKTLLHSILIKIICALRVKAYANTRGVYAQLNYCKNTLIISGTAWKVP